MASTTGRYVGLSLAAWGKNSDGGERATPAFRGSPAIFVPADELLNVGSLETVVSREFGGIIANIGTRFTEIAGHGVAYTNKNGKRHSSTWDGYRTIPRSISNALKSATDDDSKTCLCGGKDCLEHDHGIVLRICFPEDILAGAAASQKTQLSRASDGSYTMPYLATPPNLSSTNPPRLSVGVPQVKQLVLRATRPQRLLVTKPEHPIRRAKTEAGTPVDVYNIEADLACCRFEGSVDDVLLPLARLHLSSSDEDARPVPSTTEAGSTPCERGGRDDDDGHPSISDKENTRPMSPTLTSSPVSAEHIYTPGKAIDKGHKRQKVQSSPYTFPDEPSVSSRAEGALGTPLAIPSPWISQEPTKVGQGRIPLQALQATQAEAARAPSNESHVYSRAEGTPTAQRATPAPLNPPELTKAHQGRIPPQALPAVQAEAARRRQAAAQLESSLTLANIGRRISLEARSAALSNGAVRSQQVQAPAVSPVYAVPKTTQATPLVQKTSSSINITDQKAGLEASAANASNPAISRPQPPTSAPPTSQLHLHQTVSATVQQEDSQPTNTHPAPLQSSVPTPAAATQTDHQPHRLLTAAPANQYRPSFGSDQNCASCKRPADGTMVKCMEDDCADGRWYHATCRTFDHNREPEYNEWAYRCNKCRMARPHDNESGLLLEKFSIAQKRELTKKREKTKKKEAWMHGASGKKGRK